MNNDTMKAMIIYYIVGLNRYTKEELRGINSFLNMLEMDTLESICQDLDIKLKEEKDERI